MYLLVILATPLRYTAAALTTGGANGSAATTSSTLRSDAAFTAAAMAALLPAAGPRPSRDRPKPVASSSLAPCASRASRNAPNAAARRSASVDFDRPTVRSASSRASLSDRPASRVATSAWSSNSSAFGDKPHSVSVATVVSSRPARPRAGGTAGSTTCEGRPLNFRSASLDRFASILSSRSSLVSFESCFFSPSVKPPSPNSSTTQGGCSTSASCGLSRSANPCTNRSSSLVLSPYDITTSSPGAGNEPNSPSNSTLGPLGSLASGEPPRTPLTAHLALGAPQLWLAKSIPGTMASTVGAVGSAPIGSESARDQYAEYAHLNSSSVIFAALVNPPTKVRPNHPRRSLSHARIARNNLAPAGRTRSRRTESSDLRCCDAAACRFVPAKPRVSSAE